MEILLFVEVEQEDDQDISMEKNVDMIVNRLKEALPFIALAKDRKSGKEFKFSTKVIDSQLVQQSNGETKITEEFRKPITIQD